VLQPATLPAGHRLGGRYEILRVLGIGGSAVVYAARDTHIGDEIALKVLRPEKSSDVLIRRSRREAGIARGLSHPGLVRVFEWEEIDGMVCLPMELVTAGSLRDLLRSGPLPIDRAVALAMEILEAPPFCTNTGSCIAT